MFIIDVVKEHIAVTEARKLEIPIVAITDTNCDPDLIDYVDPRQRRRHPLDQAVRGQDRRRLRAGPEGAARARQPAARRAPGGRRPGAADDPRLVGRRRPARRGRVAPAQRSADARSGGHARRRSADAANRAPTVFPPTTRTRQAMAEITAQMIKDLRERTGAGMADCKKALIETGGDMEKAIEYLRKKGLASAAKKATRIASEGDGRQLHARHAASACWSRSTARPTSSPATRDFVEFAQGGRDAGGGDEPAVRLAGRDPGRGAREGEGDPAGAGQAVGQARGGDRRRSSTARSPSGPRRSACSIRSGSRTRRARRTSGRC